MIYILISIIVVLYFGSGFWVLSTMMDNSWEDKEWRFAAGVGFFLLVVTVWFVIQVSSNQAPCAQYETRLMYNASTKTMMPAQFCVQEGTWVDN